SFVGGVGRPMNVADPVPAEPLEVEIAALDERLPLEPLNRELDARPRLPAELFREMGRAGLLGLTVPTELGGRGLSPVRAARVLYRLAQRGGTLAAKLSLQPEFCSVLGSLGRTEHQRESYRQLLAGERLIGNQITEPGAGSDLRALSASVELDGSVARISGTKSQAAFAVDATEAIVLLRTPVGTDSALGAWLVPQDRPGIERVVIDDHGERWMRRGTVTYHRLELPAEAQIGEPRAAMSALRAELLRERGLLAAIYLGVARRSWEETVAFTGSRRTFGAPLAERQAISFPLAEDWVRLDSAWRQVEAVTRRLEDGTATEAETAMLKWHAGEVALTALEHAVQFHGGAGYSAELPHERRLRDVRSARIAHGTAEIAHRIATRALWPAESRAGKDF
ncbi:MAG TPA: acyl-CoA dehydrogenase family protein, partial [Thermoplasmata archaeon]|nr:acyl-CoA dehydrogenase family protein [Thermoplasmata archaeon]